MLGDKGKILSYPSKFDILLIHSISPAKHSLNNETIIKEYHILAKWHAVHNCLLFNIFKVYFLEFLPAVYLFSIYSASPCFYLLLFLP